MKHVYPSKIKEEKGNKGKTKSSGGFTKSPLFTAFLCIVNTIDNISKWIGYFACALIIPLFFTIASELFWRQFFGKSLIWTYDMTYMLYGSFFMLGAGYTLSVKGHIRSDFLYSNFSERVKAIIDIISYVVFFIPIIFMLGLYGFEDALLAWKTGERAITSVWMPQLYPFKSVIPIAAALLILQAISEVFKSSYALVTGSEL